MDFFQQKEKIIGIPEALSYYNFYPFWYGFFTKLGIKVILSGPTTKKIVQQGSRLVVSETCLPIKVYVGHVVELIERGVKNIFVPSIQSVAPKVYNCSKIRGLPDLIRNVVRGDFNIIEATLDKSEKDQGLYEFLSEAVSKFKIKDKKLIYEASKAGFKVYNNFRVMMQNGLNFDEALKNAIAGHVVINQIVKAKEVNVAVVAHAYNVYDSKVCMNIFKKLKDLNVGAFNSFQLTDEQLTKGLDNLEGHRYWANELEVTGAAGSYLANDLIDGVITINAFGCGPDSLMIERIIRKSKKFNKPILSLTIDEHTGEAGFVTRLEAFCDMLIRKKMTEKKK